MHKEIRDIIYEIQYKLDLTLEQIAERIGYTRQHLSRAIKNGTKGKLLEIIKREFADILDAENLSVPDSIKAESIEELIKIIVGEIATMKAVKTGNPVHTEIMRLYKAAENNRKNKNQQ